MEHCPRCYSTDVVATPLSGDIDDFYCPDCDRSFTGPVVVVRA